jgi:hypothetical protein
LITNIVIANADAGGTNRTITLTPQAGQQGSATITIYASDGLNTSSTSFILRVGVPSIADIPNQITYSNVPLSGIPVTISDTETAASSLTVKAVSSNPTLITNIVLGGSSSNRTVSLTPESAQTGVSTITVFVDDGINTNSTSFVLSVSPRVGLLLSDTFSYDTFDIPHALYLASFGSTNSPWQHASGNFTHQLQVTNGMAQLFFTNTLGQTNTEDLAANLTNGSFAATPFSVNSGAILYVAFTLNQSLLPSQAGDYFAHFKDTSLGTTFRAKIFASTTNAAPGSYRLGIANAVNTVNAQFPMDLNTDQAYLVVVRYNTATAESVLWVNPTSESSTYVSATDAAAASSVGSYGLREEGGIGIVNIDNLVIGTAFTEVVPVLSLTKSGNNAVLSWGDPSYALQASTNVLGVYTNIPGATSPHSYPISGSQRYFRLNR